MVGFRPKTITYTGVSAAATPTIPLDFRSENANLAFVAEKVGTGDVTYSVQGTLDDPFKSTSLTWFDLVSGKQATFAGNWANPITATRLNITAVSGSVSMKFHILQNP